MSDHDSLHFDDQGAYLVDGEPAGRRPEPPRPSGPTLTRAGVRLAKWLRENDPSWNLRPYGTGRINEMASVVLNTSEIHAEGAAQAFTEVLKGEFPLISAPDEMWEKAAAGMLAKLESLGYALAESPDIDYQGRIAGT